jgi:DNA polymerase-3 subunit gamma/tau
MQDANTISLLESSDELRERYAAQTRKGNVSNLLRALDLCAQCDLNYRASNHKRLLVEILLLQLCELLSGNAPVMPAQQNTTTPNTAPQNTPPQNTVQQPQAKPVATTPQPTQTAQQQATQAAQQQAPKQPASPTPTNAPQQAPPKSNFLSLEQLQQKQTAESTANIINAKSEQFTQNDLNREWKNILLEIKAASPAFYSVLAPASVTIKGDNQIEIIAENDIHQKEITNKIKDLVVNIRQKLQNDLVEITVSASMQIPKEKMPYTAKEKFEAMNKINPDLNNFKNELGLEVEL